MRWTQALIPTFRESAKDAEATSHQLMLRGGYVRKLASGIYSYLPLGYRVLKNVSNVIREEMDQAGAIELLLPALHPADIWKQSGRYEALGQDKIAFQNRSGQEFVLGPTHEEVVTELAGAYLKTHHLLPRTLYQIQTKFRDELRPRFGIIRTKEFAMKDAYSFDADENGLDQSYDVMYETYKRIFQRLGLTIDIVSADPGIMGGNMSHEFMVRSPYGEDHIVVCNSKKCGYTVSQDIAARKLKKVKAVNSKKKLEAFDTPNLRTVEEITSRFKLKADQLIKTILYFSDGKPVAVCVRGDHDVNEAKLRKILNAKDLRLATGGEIKKLTGAPVGFSGPVGLKGVALVVDEDVAGVVDGVTGANEGDKHFRNVCLGRDFKANQQGDLRYVENGDLCPECGGTLSVETAMEIGHVFKLGTRYSKPLKALYRASDGKERPLVMGCYGIGVNRVMAAIIEQNHDEKGIQWPSDIAPFDVHLITVNQQDEQSQKIADGIYEGLKRNGITCLFDDRKERAGVKFNDADLVGCPLQATVSPRNLANDLVEIKCRRSMKTSLVPRQNLTTHLKKQLNA